MTVTLTTDRLVLRQPAPARACAVASVTGRTRARAIAAITPQELP